MLFEFLFIKVLHKLKVYDPYTTCNDIFLHKSVDDEWVVTQIRVINTTVNKHIRVICQDNIN